MSVLLGLEQAQRLDQQELDLTQESAGPEDTQIGVPGLGKIGWKKMQTIHQPLPFIIPPAFDCYRQFFCRGKSTPAVPKLANYVSSLQGFGTN